MAHVVRRTSIPFSRLALRIATPVTVGVAALALLLHGPQASAALMGLAAGLVAYVTAGAVLTRRLAETHETLARVQQRAFEGAAALPPSGRDELAALAWSVYRTGQALDAELHELRRMEHYRREFLGDVSHELKTPIFAIQGFAETLLDGALDDERVRRAFVEKILRNTARLSALARDLTEIARIETGELRMTMGPFALARAVDETLEALEPVAAARHVRLHREGGDSLPPASGDRERIRQVLANLVDNGVKYNREGGTVTVVLAQETPERVAVSVRDTGVGIAPQHLPRLTERFYRADKHRSREVGGTGLGLSIVKHILAAHESRLEVESTPGEGSTFRFALPLLRPRA
jgi:two-component system, OmpR family, phosphate regulon sensor histidine kinase PhoR